MAKLRVAVKQEKTAKSNQPNRWHKGQSGNPCGRPPVPETEKLREEKENTMKYPKEKEKIYLNPKLEFPNLHKY